MRLSILPTALLASIISCQTLYVFTTVKTLYVISTQGQTEPATTRTFSSSIISSHVILSSVIASSSSNRSASSTKSSSIKSITTSTSSARFTGIGRSTSTVASTSSATLPSLPTATDDVSTGLYHHNIHRLNHSVPLISWNTAQATIAAEIASSCVFAHNTTVSGGGYGQNLAAYGATGAVSLFSPSLMLAKSITNQWYYGEVLNFLPSYYEEPTPGMTYFKSWGHFTQAVWKGNLTVGCAGQFCAPGTIFAGFESWFTVCNYVAPGNYLGEFGVNVFSPIELPPIGPV